jgi:hypothetical protein
LRVAQEALAARFAQAEAGRAPELEELLGRWRRGEVENAKAAGALLELLGRGRPA